MQDELVKRPAGNSPAGNVEDKLTMDLCQCLALGVLVFAPTGFIPFLMMFTVAAVVLPGQ